MALDYRIYDVFTDRPLAGNPLAVVDGAVELDAAAMQAVAREFNLSETVFLLPPVRPGHTAGLRIFTPEVELPFAGHPTVGAAIAIAETRSGTQPERDLLIVLEERVGPVRCGVRLTPEGNFAEFDLPRLPEQVPAAIDREMLAAALDLAPTEIGFENHVPAVWSAGVPFVFIPVTGLDAAKRARANDSLWNEAAPEIDGRKAACYVYCRDTMNHDCHFHARMFAPSMGIDEDPATGAAAAAFAGVVNRFDAPVDGLLRLWIEQGIEMGRPSRIRLEIDVEAGGIVRARIGGSAVKVAEGRLHL